MKDLFYSPKEKILFRVIGFMSFNQNVATLIKSIQGSAFALAEMAHGRWENVNARFVTSGGLYNNMIVLHIKTNFEPQMAQDTGEISMEKWLSK